MSMTKGVSRCATSVTRLDSKVLDHHHNVEIANDSEANVSVSPTKAAVESRTTTLFERCTRVL